MKKIIGCLFLLLLNGAATTQPAESRWHGFKRLDFVVDGRQCFLISPTHHRVDNPWIWRMEFFGVEPQADLELLGDGFSLAYMNVQNMYGAPVALDHMDAFYAELTGKYGLSAKTVLEGFSRGGLFAFNWAARHPDRVACIYADAPVCDFKSWPLGQGKGTAYPGDWKKLLAAYDMTEAEALAYKLNPVDNLKPLADARIPILCVCGGEDKTVQIDENARIVEQRYKAMGGDMTMIVKPFGDHHPHSLSNPSPIVNFILAHAAGEHVPPILVPGTPYGYDYFVQRGSLENSRYKFEHDGTGRVAFLGGSITNMKGWRDLVCDDLRRRFPHTQFEFINAGIPSFGSTPDAYRFSRDVLGHGPVDLLFVEAAVNDLVNGQTGVEPLRGMEGIIRQARVANQMTDIVMLDFVSPPMMTDIRQGKTPVVIENHEKVAEYYGVPSINLAQEVIERINKGEFTWEKDFKDLHPAPFGQKLYAASIARLLDAAWSGPSATYQSLHDVPDAPLDARSYFRATMVDVSTANAGAGWNLAKDWTPSDGAGTRAGFVHVPVLEANQSPAVLTLKFAGTGIGILVASGPDAGTVWYSIDGAPAREVNLYTQWSAKLHLPWAVMLDADLSAGQHQLELIVSKNADPRSKGHAVRIFDFLVNGS